MTQAAAQLTRGTSLFARASGYLVKLGLKGFWPLADQGIVSLGNFLMIILVGRAVSHGLLHKSEYGLFSVVPVARERVIEASRRLLRKRTPGSSLRPASRIRSRNQA